MLRGAQGRRHSGYVLMCGSCAAQQQSQNWTVAIILLVVIGGIALLFLALGIPLTEPLTKPH